MLISMCYITIPVLILVQSINSVDLYKSKRVIRNLEEIKTPYYSNHPPLQEQHIPVSVIYDDEEDIRIITKSTKEATQSTAESKVTLPSFIRNSEKPIVLTLKSQFANRAVATEAYDTLPVAVVTGTVEEEMSNKKNDEKSVSKVSDQSQIANGSPAAETYDPIPVAIVTDNAEEKKRNSKNDGESVGKVTDQEKVIESYKSTDIKEPKEKKPQGRSMKIEVTSGSDSKLNATASNVRKSSQRRRLHRVIKTNVNKNQTSRNEKTGKTPVEVTKDQTNENSKNNSQSTRSSQFQKRTQQPDPFVPIVDSENYVYAYNGDYHYSYEGGDGTKAYERGELKTAEGGSSGAEVVGGFSYTDKDGNDFSLSYTADENGYRPVGAHLPTPPPIPPAIQRALDILATKTTPEPITERVNKFN